MTSPSLFFSQSAVMTVDRRPVNRNEVRWVNSGVCTIWPFDCVLKKSTASSRFGATTSAAPGCYEPARKNRTGREHCRRGAAVLDIPPTFLNDHLYRRRVARRSVTAQHGPVGHEKSAARNGVDDAPVQMRIHRQ